MARRILLAYVSLILVVLLVLEVPLGITFRDREVQDLRVRVQGDAVALASFAEDGLENGTEPSEQLVERAAAYTRDTGGRVVVVDASGEAILDSAPPAGSGLRSFASRPEIATALAGRVAAGTRRSDTLDESLLYVAVPVASSGIVHGAVRVTFPTSAVDARVRRNWMTLAAIGAITLAAAAVAGFALARWVVRPLRDLEQATTSLGRGDLDARSPVGAGPPEVRRLAAAVNETAARLQELVGAQEAFVADASHQLRTPLTSLRLRLELLEQALDGGGRDADAAGVAAALQEVARLSRLVDGLLALARVERSAASATAEVVDLGGVLTGRAEAWSAVAAEEGATIVLEADPVLALADPDRLAQVLDNLIANAVEASPPDGTVVLACARGPGGAELHVRDEGPGLPEEARQHAFDRFWSGRDGSGRLGGSGLGLAIVQKLVEADRGHIELRAREEGGLDATVVLPLAADQTSGNMPRRGSSV